MKTKFLACFLLFMIFAGVALAAASNVTRGFSNATPAQCSNLTVSLDVVVNSTDTFYAIDEVPPSGWAITDNGTGDTQTAGHIKWIVISGAANTTHNYSVGVPCNATGVNSFSGEYGFDDAVIHNITGQTNVTVTAADTTAPALTVSSPANTTYGSSSVDLNYTASDANGISACWYRLDSGADQPLASCGNASVSSLASGNHSVIVYANDTYGNTNTSTVYFSIDTVAPALAIQSPTNTTYKTNSVDLNYTTDNTASNCWYSMDGGANTSLASCGNISMASLAQGNHSVRVAANDSIGNANASIVYFSVDTAAPSLQIQSPANTTYGTSTISLNYTADATASNCWYSLDGGSNTILASCGNTSISLGDGAHALTVYASDSAGNMNSSSISFTVDAAFPSVVFVPPTPTNGTARYVTYVYINATSSENLNQSLLEWNGVNESMQLTGNNSYKNKTGLADGLYTYLVHVQDLAGKWNSSEERTVSVNQSQINVSAQSPEIWTRRTFTRLYYTVSLGGAESATCSLYNASGNETATRNVSRATYYFNAYTRSGSGLYLFTIFCRLPEFPERNSSASISVYYDRTRPNITANFSNLYFNSTLLNLTYTAYDDLAPYLNCTMRGGVSAYAARIPANSSRTEEVNFTRQGKNTVRITCVDYTRNSGRLNARLNIDTVAPNITIRSITPGAFPNANGSRNTTISYYIYERNAVNETAYSIDGLINGSLGAAKSGTFVVPLDPGNHSLVLDCWDVAFNHGAVEQTFIVP